MHYREGFLIQIVLYTLLWFYDEYVGLLICVVMATIFAALLIFALVVELIEKSKVPRSFFIWLGISILPPILVTLAFTLIYGGNFDWINEFK